jgi:hypothetical protein
MADGVRFRRHIFITRVNIMLRKGAPKIEGLSLDASPGGMKIYSPRPLREDSCVDLEIVFQIGNRKNITEHIPAIVKWRQTESSLHGVKFLNLNAKEHPRLIGYLNRAKHRRPTKKERVLWKIAENIDAF